MDLQKEREAFEAWLFREYTNAKDFVIVYRPDENIYEHRPTQARWEAWQEAKAQAIPDGFVVVPKEPTQKMIDEFPEVFYLDTYAGECSLWVGDETVRNGYKAMIAAAQEQNGVNNEPN